MRERVAEDYKNIRKKVSKLYIAVLTKKLPVRDALARFPRDCDDKTIIAAWHALCHLEADEELRLKDKMYCEEQDEYIEYIAYALEKGEELPSNIIEAYSPYYEDALIPAGKSIKGVFHKLKKFLCD